MINTIDTIKHICNEELVTDYIDNRMNTNEKKEYIKKIENCLKERKCIHCKQLIIDFLAIKKNCDQLNQDYTMPKTVEKTLLNRIQASYIRSKK